MNGCIGLRRHPAQAQRSAARALRGRRAGSATTYGLMYYFPVGSREMCA